MNHNVVLAGQHECATISQSSSYQNERCAALPEKIPSLQLFLDTFIDLCIIACSIKYITHYRYYFTEYAFVTGQEAQPCTESDVKLDVIETASSLTQDINCYITVE